MSCSRHHKQTHPFLSFMAVYETRTPSALIERLETSTNLVIACYCAAWCDTCNSYRPDFNSLSDQWPAHTFVWIDIEEDPHLLDDHDVDDFPTILIQNPKGNVFFGAQLPYISHLERLIRSVEDANAPLVHGPGPLAGLLKQGRDV